MRRHHSEVALGGFKTVDLNIIGWVALITPGVVLAAAVAVAADLPLVPVLAVGATAAFVAGRLLDELRDRRQYLWVPVAQPADAEGRLRSAGVPAFSTATADVDGRRVEYIAVRHRDYFTACDLVGLPHESRRGRRRWEKARRAAVHLPAPR